MNHTRSNRYGGSAAYSRGVYVVALFEGAKGLLVLVAGFGVLAFIHRDIHEAAVRLVKHLHLNPASHYPSIFIDLTEHINDTRLWGMAAVATLYSIVRFIEAAGIWLRKRWAEWFAILTGGAYIPVELYEVIRKATWPRVTVLVINLFVVLYLLLVLIKDDKKAASE